MCLPSWLERILITIGPRRASVAPTASVSTYSVVFNCLWTSCTTYVEMVKLMPSREINPFHRVTRSLFNGLMSASAVSLTCLIDVVWLNWCSSDSPFLLPSPPSTPIFLPDRVLRGG